MKVIAWLLLCMALTLLFTALAFGVVQNGVVTWLSDGAVSHSVWQVVPGQAGVQYLATTTNASFLPPPNTPTNALLYVRANYRLANGSCCLESDLGFVVTPPALPGLPGTNVLRWAYPVEGYAIQSADPATGIYTTIAIFTNGPARLSWQRQQLLRTAKTVLPPPLPLP